MPPAASGSSARAAAAPRYRRPGPAGGAPAGGYPSGSAACRPLVGHRRRGCGTLVRTRRLRGWRVDDNAARVLAAIRRDRERRGVHALGPRQRPVARGNRARLRGRASRPGRVPGVHESRRPHDRRPCPRPARLCDANGAWKVDGNAAKTLKGCTDIDLGCSPSTNTLPIRRLRLGVGSSETIRAAWIRFPELTVEKAEQTYTRLDEFTYRYASGTFSAELTVDDDGLVAGYADWRRTGYATG